MVELTKCCTFVACVLLSTFLPLYCHFVQSVVTTSYMSTILMLVVLIFSPLQTVMLVLAWKLQAETMGFFTFHEWSKGMLSIE